MKIDELHKILEDEKQEYKIRECKEYETVEDTNISYYDVLSYCLSELHSQKEGVILQLNIEYLQALYDDALKYFKLWADQTTEIISSVNRSTDKKDMILFKHSKRGIEISEIRPYLEIISHLKYLKYISEYEKIEDVKIKI